MITRRSILALLAATPIAPYLPKVEATPAVAKAVVTARGDPSFGLMVKYWSKKIADDVLKETELHSIHIPQSHLEGKTGYISLPEGAKIESVESYVKYNNYIHKVGGYWDYD